MPAALEVLAGLDGAPRLTLGGHAEALRAAGCSGFTATLNAMGDPRVPGVSLATLQALAAAKLTVHVHLLAEAPDRWLEALAAGGVRSVAVAVEGVVHLHRTLALAQDLGLTAGVVLRPGTPLTALTYILQTPARIVLLTEEPGRLRHAVLGGTYDRVRILRENLRYHRLRTRLQVAGHMAPHEAARLSRLGATELAVHGMPGAQPSLDAEAYTTFIEQLATTGPQS